MKSSTRGKAATSTPQDNRAKLKEKAERRAHGRPSTYTKAIADAICAQLSEGRSLRSICEDEDMPSQRAVYGWLSKHDEFVQQYARAREAQADYLFEECLEIADDASRDFITSTDKNGAIVKRPNYEHINRARLRVDTRKWMTGKLAPKKYGDKVIQAITGKNGESPAIIEVRWKEPGESGYGQ
jgi:hypothetical protein